VPKSVTVRRGCELGINVIQHAQALTKLTKPKKTISLMQPQLNRRFRFIIACQRSLAEVVR